MAFLLVKISDRTKVILCSPWAGSNKRSSYSFGLDTSEGIAFWSLFQEVLLAAESLNGETEIDPTG